jgi:hypothetical protein
MKKKTKKKWFFTVVEEAIFGKGLEDYAGGRIEIWHKDYPYDVEEIHLILPRKLFNKIREALDFQECDKFQIGDVFSEELEKFIKAKKLNRRK